jgi:hypothetical protein
LLPTEVQQILKVLKTIETIEGLLPQHLEMLASICLDQNKQDGKFNPLDQMTLICTITIFFKYSSLVAREVLSLCLKLYNRQRFTVVGIEFSKYCKSLHSET